MRNVEIQCSAADLPMVAHVVSQITTPHNPVKEDIIQICQPEDQAQSMNKEKTTEEKKKINEEKIKKSKNKS